MNLKKILTPDTIWCDLRATTKEELIEEFIDRLFAAGKIKDRFSKRFSRRRGASKKRNRF